MGLILAGILLCVLIIGLAFLLLSKGIVSSFGSELLFLLAAVCLIAGAFAGITAPVNGYGKHEIVSTINFIPIFTPFFKILFVIISTYIISCRNIF